MNGYSLLILFLILAPTASADQLDGLVGLETILTVTIVGVLNIIVLLFSAVIRFSRDKYKVSIPMNFACVILIVCSLISIITLGSTIDPGFLTTCLGIALISVILIILNYRVGINSKSED